MLLSALLQELEYDQSPHYRSHISEFEPETAHLFRAARDAGVSGIYVFQTSPAISRKIIVDRPAVYVAQAEDLAHTRSIHRSLWNLGYAPYLIVLLPDQIRFYTGFKYSVENPDEGFLDAIPLNDLRLLLAEFSVAAIDTGRIWQKGKYKNQLDEQERVDKRLLKNLRQLGKELKNQGLDASVAHALIGKYVYIRYLWDREILTEAWLQEQQIEKVSVFSQTATADGLSRLIAALEGRFNGKIFPIDFTQTDAPTDLHIQLTASVFLGDETVREHNNTIIRQLHLDFQAYNFAYIPIEILSEVYEQFIEDARKKGAIYTPEILADYLLSEVNSVKPLTEETKILDPACGSGVFLVLAYRRLIEAELGKSGKSKLSDEKLKALLSNIYGVERELDACYVAEFSLILTLLNYVDPHELQKIEFHFPSLHNAAIFHCDFFDIEGTHDGQFWQRGLTFDVIIGNPPWIELKDDGEERLARQWMQDRVNKIERPISGKRVAEAFSWLVTGLLRPEGIVGLLLPATSLVNLEARNYRRRFFTRHCVFRITNFSNLRWILFPKNEFPAFTIVYRPLQSAEEVKSPIIHYAPLSIDQVADSRESPWAITINEQEIQMIDPLDAETGETLVWKLALWGTFQDKKAIECIEAIFPFSIGTLCTRKNWYFSQGAELRDKRKFAARTLNDIDDLKGKKRFQREKMTDALFRFSVPSDVLSDIPDEMCAIRKRGGERGLTLTQAPHIVISPSWGSYVTFSDVDFVFPPRVIGIAGPQEDADRLRALSLYLNSSLVSYYLFFHVPEWGVSRNARYITLSELRKVPVPDFSSEQVEGLVTLHRSLVADEHQHISEVIAKVRNLQMDFLNSHQTELSGSLPVPELLSKMSKEQRTRVENEVNAFHEHARRIIDEKIFDLFAIPEDIHLLVTEFVRVRLLLDRPTEFKQVIREPREQELLDYARELRDELDGFVGEDTHHGITITYSPDLIECVIDVMNTDTPIALDSSKVRPGDVTSSRILSELSESLKEQVSQWIYVQRGLRLFDGPRIHLYKPSRLIDWTRTQAMNDAGDILGEVLVEQ
jgi:Eco57I restriction-modification methylase